MFTHFLSDFDEELEKSGTNLLFEMRNIVYFFPIYSFSKMLHAYKLWIEGYVIAFYQEKYSYFLNQGFSDMHSIKISK